MSRVHTAGNGVNAGDFIVAVNANIQELKEIATKIGVNFTALNTDVASVSKRVKQLRIGLFQRYLGGNMDEGWTRLLLENFEFPYKTLMDKEIIAGNLKKKYDVIILPDDNLSRMTGKKRSDRNQKRWESYPLEYRTGFGQVGIDALKVFVEQGEPYLHLLMRANYQLKSLSCL